MTARDPLDAFVTAVVQAHDPIDRLVSAVSGVFAAAAGSGLAWHWHGERLADGRTSLAVTNASSRQTWTIVMSRAEAREVAAGIRKIAG